MSQKVDELKLAHQKAENDAYKARTALRESAKRVRALEQELETARRSHTDDIAIHKAAWEHEDAAHEAWLKAYVEWRKEQKANRNAF